MNRLRLSEIAQLLAEDVRQVHGVWIFHVAREGSALKSTKTAGSQRVAPILSELVDLESIDNHQAIARGEKISRNQANEIFFRLNRRGLQCLLPQNKGEGRQLGEFPQLPSWYP